MERGVLPLGHVSFFIQKRGLRISIPLFLCLPLILSAVNGYFFIKNPNI